MPKERPNVIPAVYLVLKKGDQILLSRRCNTGYQDGMYGFPAGHLNNDEETFRQAMVREAKEEIGIEIDLFDLVLVHIMHRKQQEPTEERRISLFFAVKKWRGNPKVLEPSKCDDLNWFNIDSLPDNTINYIKQAINCIKNNIVYSEYGWQ